MLPPFAYFPLAHTSHSVLPSVLDQPAGQDTHVRVPSYVPEGTPALLQTPSALQLNASQPLAIATEEDPPAAILPASGLMQLVGPRIPGSTRSGNRCSCRGVEAGTAGLQGTVYRACVLGTIPGRGLVRVLTLALVPSAPTVALDILT